MTKPYTKRTMMGYRFSQSNANHVDPTGSSSYYNVQWEDRADGYTFPRYKESIARSEQAGTTFSAQKLRINHTDGVAVWKGTAEGVAPPDNVRMYDRRGVLAPHEYQSLQSVGIFPSSADSEAASKFYNKASGELKAIEGGELLGEMGRTAKEVIRTARDLVGLLQPWKRRVSRRLDGARTRRQAAAGVADAYLRWKFGWDPLVKDIRKLYSGLDGDHEQVVAVKGNGKSTTPMGPAAYYRVGIGLGSYGVSVQDRQECTVRYHGGIKVHLPGPKGFAERLGLSPSNFVPTLYNLLPWTYMIDYFTNLGDMVSAIGFPRSQIAWCMCTVRYNREICVLAGIDPEVNDGLKMDAGYPLLTPSKTSWLYSRVERSVSMPPYLPSLHLKFPNFGTEGGRMKGLNIAAVLASQTWGNGAIRNKYG